MKWPVCICFVIISLHLHGQSGHKLYLLPGQGSDHRIFSNLNFPESVDTIHLHYLQPEAGEGMHSYAGRMANCIDTAQPFSVLGVSLGGMVAVEMCNYLQPEQVIILSSAANPDELPKLYRWFRGHNFYTHIPAPVFKWSTYILQPIFEPDRSRERKTCNAMIRDKDASFIKHAVHLIVSWEMPDTSTVNTKIIHIHGDADNTLPVENTHAAFIVENGSHMMTLVQARDISEILEQVLVKDLP